MGHMAMGPVAMKCMATGSHLPLLPAIILGSFAVALEQENQPRPCFVYMDQGETLRSGFPALHGLLHGARCQHVQVGSGRALPPSCDADTNCRPKLPLRLQRCLCNTSPEDTQSELESAGEKRPERGGSSWETQ